LYALVDGVKAYLLPFAAALRNQVEEQEDPEMKRRVAIVAALLVLAFAAPALAQIRITQLGDYDEVHQWHDAGWWWTNHPDWVRSHHPTWWGDYDDGHVWRPAGWWWQSNPGWVRRHHPEWWGDWDDNHVWQPADWWWQHRTDWVRSHHPE